MKVYVVSDHMTDDAGVDDTLKVFTDKKEAKEYEDRLAAKHTSNWEFTSFEERDLID